ncbi:MAG: hypothetical protein AAGF93_17565 [Cyanobacteria bacterium P01_H01_bin.105]
MAKTTYYQRIVPIYDQTRWMIAAVAEDVADFVTGMVSAGGCLMMYFIVLWQNLNHFVQTITVHSQQSCPLQLSLKYGLTRS